MSIHKVMLPLLGCILSVQVIASEEASPSFYGGRGMTQGEATGPKSEIEFQRRAIAPSIIVEANGEPLNEFESSSVLPINEVTPKKITLDLSRLDRNDWLLAKKSKHYFDRNYHPETGLWDSVQGYHHATMWDVASGIAATIAAYDLELASREVTKDTLTLTLNTLAELPLYKNTLPNREYSTESGLPSGSYSESDSNGNGWSALDIGRLLIWLKVTQERFPDLSRDIEKILQRWSIEKAVKDGNLFGTKLYQGKEYYRQEGRLGYLQYAAQGFVLFGYDLDESFSWNHIEAVEVDNQKLLIDQRNLPYFTTDPYVLLAIEIGNLNAWWNQLDTLYELHKSESALSGKLKVYAEDAMNKSPWFAYNNVYYYGKPWISVSPGGKPIENPQIFSNKVGFGLSVIFEDEFAATLTETVLNSSLSSRSIPTGIYENGGTNTAYNINTNSLVLTALWYKALGKNSIYDFVTNDSLVTQ
ncbi:DUF3131 domain-containing protein [Vibrio sp. SCSIO 43140]|uniref:DUF3131 domain-containing protein n=1 Tax=Vibrio sp. SCSIO 43140 TaxID=2819100 RepID=UPI002074B702|nr:DUF3131 domain-containing protein [Vibrio sp. SCSIO 43140]